MARDFNGTTDRIDWATIANLKGLPITISAWVYFDRVNTNQFIVMIHANGDAVYGIALTNMGGISSGCLRSVRHGTTDKTHRSNGAVVATGAWTHCLITDDGTITDYTTSHIYVAGVEVGYAAGANGATEATQSGTWSIGGRLYDDTVNFDGQIAEVGVWNRVLAAGEIAELAAGYAPSFMPSGLLFYTDLVRNAYNKMGAAASTEDGTTVIAHPRIIYPVRYRLALKALSGATVLVVQDAAQAQSADNVALTQLQKLVVAEASQAHSADNVALTQHQVLAVAEASQAHSAENVALTQHQVLAVAEAAQAQSADNVALTQHQVLVVAEAGQAHRADHVALTQHQVLAVAEASQAQSADNVALVVNLAVAEANHAHTADPVVLTQHQALVVAEARHVQIADNVALGGVPTALMVQDAHHVQMADSITLCRDYFLFILFIAMSHTANGYITRSKRVIGQSTRSVEVETEL
jgi:hypothetical protein